MIKRHPFHGPGTSGEILREDILPALSVSRTAVADALEGGAHSFVSMRESRQVEGLYGK